MADVNLRDLLKTLQIAYQKTSQEEWTIIATDEGTYGVQMGPHHNYEFDLEGSCGECFGNVDFIVLAHKWLPVLILELALGESADETFVPEPKEGKNG